MKIIECPRDAMQGLKHFVPTDLKIQYINQLLKVGFDTIDFGSFVSPKAIPQLADTAEVLAGLHLYKSESKLLAIIANVRGAKTAVDFDEITYLGYPLSLSETFQQRNTNRSIDDAFNDLAEIQELCEMNGKILVVYLSMGFGNPYGDPYEVDYVGEFITKLDDMSVSIISLADTIGVSDEENISELFSSLIPKFPHIELGAHLHSTMDSTREKIHSAFKSGCRRMDGAINGFGGCPMAEDKLVGNLATERMIEYFESYDHEINIKKKEFEAAMNMAPSVFLGR